MINIQIEYAIVPIILLQKNGNYTIWDDLAVYNQDKFFNCYCVSAVQRPELNPITRVSPRIKPAKTSTQSADQKQEAVALNRSLKHSPVAEGGCGSTSRCSQ